MGDNRLHLIKMSENDNLMKNVTQYFILFEPTIIPTSNSFIKKYTQNKLLCLDHTVVCILVRIKSPKILKKPSIVQKKMIPHMKAFGLFKKKKQKKYNFFEKKNSKWPPIKEVIFQLRQFSIFFCENFMDWSLGR